MKPHRELQSCKAFSSMMRAPNACILACGQGALRLRGQHLPLGSEDARASAPGRHVRVVPHGCVCVHIWVSAPGRAPLSVCESGLVRSLLCVHSCTRESCEVCAVLGPWRGVGVARNALGLSVSVGSRSRVFASRRVRRTHHHTARLNIYIEERPGSNSKVASGRQGPSAKAGVYKYLAVLKLAK